MTKQKAKGKVRAAVTPITPRPKMRLKVNIRDTPRKVEK